MTRRLLTLIVLAAALIVPGASLADDGGNGSAPAAGARAGHLGGGALLDRISQRLDKRFQAFSSHCRVANPSEKCAKTADRFFRRLNKLQSTLVTVEGKIKEKCAAANPRARCLRSGEVIARIDTLLGTIGSDTAAIKAAFPSAGS